MQNNNMEDLEYGEYFPEGFEYLDCIPPWEGIPEDFETKNTVETEQNIGKEIIICAIVKM